MAHQGHESNPNRSKQRQQPDRDRESNLGQGAGGLNHPTGTSGRQDDSNPSGPRRIRRDDDDEPGLSTRTTNR